MQAQCKQCVECGATFQRKPNRSAAQWAKQTCCSGRCANTLRARGRPPQRGDLLRSELGKQGYINEWQRRRSMPMWAEWWEDRRRAEDLEDLKPKPLTTGRAAQRLSAAPKPRRFIAGECPDCGTANVVAINRWHGSIRCPACTKKRWQQNHAQRARENGVAYEDIPVADVFARDKRICQICGRKTRGKYPAPTSASVDHIIPISRGGPHLMHNLQTACLRCNLQKHNGAANDQLRLAV